jgi:hypothetical protein
MRGATQIRQPNELAPAECRIETIYSVDKTATPRETVAQTIACMLEKNQARMKKSIFFCLNRQNRIPRIIFSLLFAASAQCGTLRRQSFRLTFHRCPANATSNFNFAR